MAEKSIMWTTSGVGDGDAGGYTMVDMLTYLAMLWLNDKTLEGVAPGYLNALEVTVGGGDRNLQIDTGGGLDYGFPYWSTSAVTKQCTHPVVGTTGWRLVLRATWATQLVRITLLESADGVATAPNVTQDGGVTWDISIAYGTITTGDVLSITDDRHYLHPNIEVVLAMLAEAVSDKLVTGGDLHDHEEGEGAALGPGAITDRTRTFFIPVVAGYDETAGETLTNFDFMGLELVDDHECWGYGWWQVPVGFVSALTIEAVVIAYANGNIYSENRTRYGKNLELHNQHTDNSGLAASGVAADYNACIDLTTLSDAEEGDIVRITYTRLAQNDLDTINDHIKVAGWIAQCTMDS